LNLPGPRTIAIVKDGFFHFALGGIVEQFCHARIIFWIRGLELEVTVRK
jgi:hypothetical protein